MKMLLLVGVYLSLIAVMAFVLARFAAEVPVENDVPDEKY